MRLRTIWSLLPLLLVAACAPLTGGVPPRAPAPGIVETAPPAAAPQAAVPSAPADGADPVAPLLEPFIDPPPDPARAAPPPASVAPEAVPGDAPPPAPGYESVATYYAKKFNGRKTITGERYDPNLMTAATHEVPLGTQVRVVNPQNGREVVVRVNDRPRKRKFPLIDLSRAAARELGFIGKGKIRVRVIPLPPAEGVAATEQGPGG